MDGLRVEVIVWESTWFTVVVEILIALWGVVLLASIDGKLGRG